MLREQELLDLFQEVMGKKESPEGVLTTRQIAQQKGRGEQWVRTRLLRPLLEAGKIEPVSVGTKRIDGILTTVKGYRKVDDTGNTAIAENHKGVFND